jgi:hypothetical protein
MHIRLFGSVATLVLAGGLSGCHVQSTVLTPTLAPLPYASPGQILEFQGSTPSYVVFYGASPCAEPFYPIQPNKPARCKVLKGSKGYFEYYFQTERPREHAHARTCPYCQVIIVGPVNTGGAGPSQPGESTEVKTGSAASTGVSHPYPPVPVACDSDTGIAEVDNSVVQNGVQTGDKLSWIPMNPDQAVTVTMPSGVCSGGQNGVFTAQDACTVTGTPGTYPYTVKLDQCTKGGNSTLTIVPSPH